MQKYLAAALSLTSFAVAQEKGHAKAELLLSSSTYQAGKDLHAAIRMTYEAGWHGYWTNPGEGGMKTEVVWTLPAGWTASELEFPVPKHEITGGLACYGYAGTVIIPVILHPAAQSTGEVKIQGQISWLACTDKECAAGDAPLSITLQPGEAQPTEHAETIAAARSTLPMVEERLHVSMKDAGDKWLLQVNHVEGIDLEGAEVFPVTEQALDPAEPIKLKRTKDVYEVSVAKNEFAKKDLAAMELVIASANQKAYRVVGKKAP